MMTIKLIKKITTSIMTVSLMMGVAFASHAEDWSKLSKKKQRLRRMQLHQR